MTNTKDSHWQYRAAITEGSITMVKWADGTEGAKPLSIAFSDWSIEGWELVAAVGLPSGNIQYVFRKEAET